MELSGMYIVKEIEFPEGIGTLVTTATSCGNFEHIHVSKQPISQVHFFSIRN